MSSGFQKKASIHQADTDVERQVFSAARQLHGETRADYLSQACGDNRKLHQRIVSLLEAADNHSDLLDRNFKSVYFELSGARVSTGGSKTSSVEEVLALFEPSAENESALGRISHYEIRELIGRGAFGVVFKAFDEKLEREVAIKVLNPLLSTIPAYRERFLKEARSAASIQHPNVVKIHSVDESPFPFIVMELVNGETLQSRIRREGPMATQEIVDVSIQVCQGLAAAHKKGLVHLDVKPSNILLHKDSSNETRAKLTDFGLALAINGEGQVVSDSVLGTPAYMSPEQAKGEKIDQRADLFSLGSVIFTMCSGQAAFSGGETLSVMRGVMEAERIELPDGVRIEKRLSRVINRLHSALPENRYRSADEVLQDLRRQSGNPKRRLLLPLAYITAFVLVLGFLVGGTSFILNGTFLPSGKATWTQARQRLADVTSEIERVDSFFESDDCFYEIDHGKFTYLNIPYSYDLSAFGQFSDVEHLVLTPRNPRDNTPVDISFVDSMNKLRVVELANFPVESLEPLRGHQLEKLHLWYVQTKGQPYPSHVDLDPLKGMPLKWLNCGGCIIESLEPLKGMKLEFLCLNESAKISDLSPLIGMPIHKLIIAKSDISDLTPMSRSQLKILDISGSKVRDLSPLVGLKLEHLLMNRSQIDDLAILKKCHIKTLDMDYEPGHEELVKSIPGLETLNQMPLADFIKANRKQ